MIRFHRSWVIWKKHKTRFSWLRDRKLILSHSFLQIIESLSRLKRVWNLTKRNMSGLRKNMSTKRTSLKKQKTSKMNWCRKSRPKSKSKPPKKQWLKNLNKIMNLLLLKMKDKLIKLSSSSIKALRSKSKSRTITLLSINKSMSLSSLTTKIFLILSLCQISLLTTMISEDLVRSSV